MVSLRNDSERYGLVARALHWLMALLLVGLFALGWWMTDLTYYDRWYQTAFSLHDAFGVLALALAFTRIGWALADRPPALVPTLAPWGRVAAKATHYLLYLLLIAVPVSGYFITTADGRSVEFFDLFAIPPLLPASEGREEIAGEVREILAYVGGGLVLLHAAAALKHALIDRDGTLSKMIGRGPSPTA